MVVVWLGGAVLTKMLVFSKSRTFLQNQADVQLVDWLDITSSQTLTALDLIHRDGRFLMVWQNDSLLIHEGQFSLPQPLNKNNYIHKVAGANWVIAEDCHANACVILGIEDTKRQMLVRSLVVLIFIPLLVVFLLTMIAIYLAVTSTLNPLNNLARIVSNTSPERLSRLPAHKQSQELLPLVQALNQLIENMRMQLHTERQFLDTCTHEIRTPITALVAHIQSIENIEEPLKSKLEQMQLSALRTVRVANQFLVLGRNRNAEAMASDEKNFDLCELTRQISADHAQDNPQLQCQMLGEASLAVKADMFAIELAIRNIIENCIKYGSKKKDSDVEVHISIFKNDKLATIAIEDSGPGVEPVFREKLLERFYRLPTQEVTGAGLGLSIVQATAQRYNGCVSIERSDALGGLKVSVSFNIIE